MDGSCSLVWYIHDSMHTSVNIFLDFPFWGAWNDHFRSWATVYFKCLVSALRDVKHHASPNDCLSSWGEWRSQKTPPPPQGCASCSRRRGNLGQGITMVTPRNSHSRGKTLVFPLLRQFLELQLSCQMSFCMEKNFLLITFLKFFWKLWMLLLFLSLATIIWVTCCLRSCQLTSSAPPSYGYAKAASSPLSSAPMMAPTLSWAGDPAPSPSESGQGMRSSLSAAWKLARTDAKLGSPRYRRRWPGPGAGAKPATARPGGPAATKRVSFSDPLVSSPSAWVPPGDGRGTVFLPPPGFT